MSSAVKTKNTKINVKKYISEEIIDLFITVLLSCILELSKQVFKSIFSTIPDSSQIDIAEIFLIIDMSETLQIVLNIILLTLIIWCVTCISKMFSQDNAGKKNKLHTSLLLTFFVLSLIWYIFENIFLFSLIKAIIYFILYILLLVTMLIYYDKKNNKHPGYSKFECNHRVA